MEQQRDLERYQKAAKAEAKKLNKLVKLVPENKKDVAKSIAQELSFMAGTLEELKSNIAQNGAVEWFQNGKQEMWRESPALKSYNTTIQRYSLLSKQLCDLLPKEEAVKAKEGGLMDFLGV